MAIDLKGLNHTQLDDLISRAATRKAELAQESVSKVRDKIQSLLRTEGLTLGEVFPTRKARSDKGQRSRPKYRNPADHEQTWSGRGKRPRWFHAALAAGKKEKDLLA